MDKKKKDKLECKIKVKNDLKIRILVRHSVSCRGYFMDIGNIGPPHPN
jgi:hypothetical protein